MQSASDKFIIQDPSEACCSFCTKQVLIMSLLLLKYAAAFPLNFENNVAICEISLSLLIWYLEHNGSLVFRSL